MRFPFVRFRIEGNSMSPTIKTGEKVFISRYSRIRPGDIVVFQKGGLTMVKRAIQKENSGWLMRGDNPSESTDSLDFGTVSDRHIIGKVLWKH